MAQSEAQLAVEKWWIQSQKYSINSNDALFTLFSKGFETILVVLSRTSDNSRIDHAITSPDSERKVALQFENKDFDILRHLCFGLIESLQVLLEVKGKNIEEQNQTLVDEAPNSSVTIVEPKAEPIDPIDQFLEGNQPIFDEYLGESLFKEEEIDFDFGVKKAALPIEKPLNELPSNEQDCQGNVRVEGCYSPNEALLIVDSDMMGDEMNFMEDPIIDSTPIEEGSLNKVSLNAENADESAQNKIIGEANDLMKEEEEKDGTVHRNSDIPKDSYENREGEKKVRPKRISSRSVNYTEFLGESEPVKKKPNIKSNCDKKIDNKRKSDNVESSSTSSKKSILVSKINPTELECPNCEYRSRSVPGWVQHLRAKHSTCPRELGLALVCDCGTETFSSDHNLRCDISKITIVAKRATPKCVMCEIHPKTVLGYAGHLRVHHKTSLLQMGMFLLCSCGRKFTTEIYDPEHSKECNGYEFTIHKLDEE